MYAVSELRFDEDFPPSAEELPKQKQLGLISGIVLFLFGVAAWSALAGQMYLRESMTSELAVRGFELPHYIAKSPVSYAWTIRTPIRRIAAIAAFALVLCLVWRRWQVWTAALVAAPLILNWLTTASLLLPYAVLVYDRPTFRNLPQAAAPNAQRRDVVEQAAPPLRKRADKADVKPAVR